MGMARLATRIGSVVAACHGPRSGAARLGVWMWALAVAWLVGCGSEDGGADGEPATAAGPAATLSAAVDKPGRFVQPPVRPFDSNPLELPAAAAEVAEGQHIYTAERRALAGARLGSTLVLRSGTAVGIEGGNVMVQMGRQQPYPVHPGYVIVPQPGRLLRGTYVLAPHRGELRHGVVVTAKPDRVLLRYTDVGVRLGDRALPASAVAPQPSGLAPGNYAVYRQGPEVRLVVLVSSAAWSDGKHRWLVLGFGAEAQLVEQSRLTPQSPDLRLKAGDDVWVAWLGVMEPATVRDVDAPGLYTVSRPRLGPSLVVGADLLMKPLAPAP